MARVPPFLRRCRAGADRRASSGCGVPAPAGGTGGGRKAAAPSIRPTLRRHAPPHANGTPPALLRHAWIALCRGRRVYYHSCKPQTVGWGRMLHEVWFAKPAQVERYKPVKGRRRSLREIILLCLCAGLFCCPAESSELQVNGRLRKERHEEARKGSGGRRAYGAVP